MLQFCCETISLARMWNFIKLEWVGCVGVPLSRQWRSTPSTTLWLHSGSSHFASSPTIRLSTCTVSPTRVPAWTTAPAVIRTVATDQLYRRRHADVVETSRHHLRQLSTNSTVDQSLLSNTGSCWRHYHHVVRVSATRWYCNVYKSSTYFTTTNAHSVTEMGQCLLASLNEDTSRLRNGHLTDFEETRRCRIV